MDFIIIGGGATGLGIAADAATRGYSTLLLEQSDFAKATSARSTKLVHGGVRYLQKGDVALVREALRERGYLQECTSPGEEPAFHHRKLQVGGKSRSTPSGLRSMIYSPAE
ncbi:MAG: FAD-dependent oxidoreductase [Bacteroidales bacterium]